MDDECGVGRVRALDAAVARLGEGSLTRLTIERAAAEVVPAWSDLCVVALSRGAGPELTSVGSREAALALGDRVAGGARPVRRVLDSGRPRLFVDACDADAGVRFVTGELGLTCTVFAPIASDRRILGCLALAQTSVSSRRLGALDVELSSILARSIALVSQVEPARPADDRPLVCSDPAVARRAMQRAIDAGHRLLLAAAEVMQASDLDGSLRGTDVARFDSVGGGWCAVVMQAPADGGARFDEVVERLAQRGWVGVAELMPGDDAAALIARAVTRLHQWARPGRT